MLAQTQTPATTWTTEEIAARKALWTAVVARLEAVMPTGTYEEMLVFQAAVEREVGCTYRELQAAISGQAGPLSVYTQAAAKIEREMVTYGHFDGEGDVRGRGSCRIGVGQRRPPCVQPARTQLQRWS